MESSRGITEARLKTVLKRQEPPGWGRDYEPGIKATVDEAPPGSRPSTVWSSLLERHVHLLSLAERAVLMIILYLARRVGLFDLHEQRMLPFNPARHPLATHAKARGMALPSLRGTVAVAGELGCLHFHPVIYEEVQDGEDMLLSPNPFPMFGDFLLFLEDDLGPWCVNHSVKDKRAEFFEPTINVTIKTNRARRKKKAAFRQAVEEILYLDGTIPTRLIAAEDIPPILTANLSELILWTKRKSSLDDHKRSELLRALRAGLESGKSGIEVFSEQERVLSCTTNDLQVELHQAIWRHDLPVELCDEYFFIDQPMIPESRPVFDQFDHWFAREVQ